MITFDKNIKRNKRSPIYLILGAYTKFYFAYKRVSRQCKKRPCYIES